MEILKIVFTFHPSETSPLFTVPRGVLRLWAYCRCHSRLMGIFGTDFYGAKLHLKIKHINESFTAPTGTLVIPRNPVGSPLLYVTFEFRVCGMERYLFPFPIYFEIEVYQVRIKAVSTIMSNIKVETTFFATKRVDFFDRSLDSLLLSIISCINAPIEDILFREIQLIDMFARIGTNLRNYNLFCDVLI